MTYADPPDEIYDRKAPGDRDIDAPNSDTPSKQIRYREKKQHQEQKADRESKVPRAWMMLGQRDRRNRLGDTFVRLARRKQPSRIAEWGDFVTLFLPVLAH